VLAALAVTAAIGGLLIGSFLNVVIHRLPRRESVVHPRSRCPACEAAIAPRDNIPLLSWIVLRGRCRHCGTAISGRYPLVELATGLLFGATTLAIGAEPELPAFLVFTAALIAASAIDLEHHIIPNRLVFPTLGLTAAGLVAAAAADGDWGRVGDGAVGAGAFSGVLLVLNLVYPAGMGFGDVKFASLLGLALGWLRPGLVAVALFGSFLAAAVVGLALIITGVRGRKDPVPFGPFLAVATYATILVGDATLDAYLPG